MVYGHILTDPLGVRFRVKNNNVGLICQHTPSTEVSCSQRTAICKKRSSFISSPNQPSNSSGFNQIQYVNRNCYEECHGLEFRYNEVWFEDCDAASGGELCQRLVNKIAGKKYAHYFKASIHSSIPSFRPAVNATSPLKLVEFCTQYPKASIKLYNPSWSQERPGFMLLGFGYMSVIRGDETMLTKLLSDLRLSYEFDLTSLKILLPKEGIPKNFRMFPAEHYMYVDQETLYSWCQDIPLLRDGGDIIVTKLIETWFTEGL
jgi:hypothetical protein